MTKKALISIDLQNDYFPGGDWELFGIEEASAKAATAIEKARSDGSMVIHVRHEFSAADAPFFRAGSRGSEINSTVSPKANELVITKNSPNAFLNTCLHSSLEKEGVTSLTIVGAMSHMCIEATARAASDLGFEVTVIEDACATRRLEYEGEEVPAKMVHASAMASLSFAYAKVVRLDTQAI